MEAVAWQKNGHAVLWQQLKERTNYYDLIVIGGGITGAGIALAAAQQQQKVLLLERQDFSWGTSSRSSKMVHGGLRYMAQGDIKTTRQSVQERERLLLEAPGLVEIMNYAMPHYRKQFPPGWIFNSLLWVYDLFAGKRYRQYFPASSFLQQHPFLKAEGLVGGTRFADAVTDDSRLVMRVLHEAREQGADCLNYIAVDKLLQHNEGVVGVQATNQENQESIELFAKVVVNATGAWVDELRSQLQQPPKIRPARGSHIVIPADRLPVQQSLTILHPQDQRPIFIYPWEGRTVIGTTDIDHGALANQEVSISSAEVNYLLELVEHYCPTAHINKQDILSTFSGVRPLIAGGALNPSKEKRNHSVWVEKGLISVSGGKLTTFRIIAEDTLQQAKRYLSGWQSGVTKRIFKQVSCQHNRFLQLPATQQKRLLGYYGSKVDQIFSDLTTKDLEPVADTVLLWFELRLAARYEAVQHLDDLLLRRTRVGLLLKEGAAECFDKVKEICLQELDWDDSRWQAEVKRYQAIIQKYYSLPSSAA